MGCFSQLPWLPIVYRVFSPFHIQTTSILTKIKRLICSQQGLNPQPLNHKAIAQSIQPSYVYVNSSNSIVMLSPNIIMHMIKINNKSNNTYMTYIGLEPKSFHTTKVLSTT